MSQIGSKPVSLRGPQGWRGMTVLTQAERGDRRLGLLENCYVSSDGNEIRTFPGWKTVLDFSTTKGVYGSGVGFDRLTVDAARDVWKVQNGYYEHILTHGGPTGTNPTEYLYAFARPTSLHGMKFVRGRLVIYGESDFVKEPICTSTATTPPTPPTDFVTIASYTAAANCVLTTNVNYRASTALNGSPWVGAGPRDYAVVYIENTGSLELDGKFHRVINQNGTNTITLNTTTTVASSGVSGRIYMVRPGLTMPGSSGDTYYSTVGGNNACDDVESLTSWTLDTNLSVSSLIKTNGSVGARCAWVANRQRDFGDPAIASSGRRYEGMLNQYSRRRRARLPYRMVSDVAGERLLLAAPGYGCVFQVPKISPIDPTDPATATSSGIPFRNNDLFDKPRCVGVPKAVMWVDYNTTLASGPSWNIADAGGVATGFSFGGTLQPARAGAYKFKVAYRDEATGEVGLCSEPVTITTDAATYAGHDQKIQLRVLHPGYLMSESLATSVLVFRTAKGSDTYYLCYILGTRTQAKAGITGGAGIASIDDQSIKYGATTYTADQSRSFYMEFSVPYVDDTSLALDKTAVPSIEQMPMGHKCMRTVRNHTFYGGHLGSTGQRRELIQGKITTQYKSPTGGAVTKDYPYYNQFSSRFAGNIITGNITNFPADGVWNAASGSIPPAYIPQCTILGLGLVPFPSITVGLNRSVNTTSLNGGTYSSNSFNPGALTVRYEVSSSGVNQGLERYLTEDTTFVGQDAWLNVPRGLYEVSEVDFPGVVDSHQAFVDSEIEEDIEGIGEFQGGVVLATRSNSYTLNWARTPFIDGVEPATPDQVSSQFGCIAANTMCEYDGGCCWISDRGPVAITQGGVEWIGRELERYFVGSTSRYRRDSEGMMRHAWACHDAERGLVYFGLCADPTGTLSVSYRGTNYTWNTANQAGKFDADEAKSRMPADEVLVWSYRQNAWSRWIPPKGMEVLWMERGYDDVGAQRIFMLCADWRIYALDDAYSDTNAAVLALQTVNAGTASSDLQVTTGYGTDEAARDAGTFIRGGMGVLIVAQDLTIRGYSTVAAAPPGGSITLSSPVTWSIGDTALFGARSATITTNSFSLSTDGQGSARKVTLRYSLWGTSAAIGAARANVTVPKRSGAGYSNNASTTPISGDDSPAIYMGNDVLGGNPERTISFSRGLATGQEVALTATIYHCSQTRISDIWIDTP